MMVLLQDLPIVIMKGDKRPERQHETSDVSNHDISDQSCAQQRTMG